MKVKIEIPVVAGWDSAGVAVYKASASSHAATDKNLLATEEWAFDDDCEGQHAYIITAEVDLPELPAVQEVQGEAREVKP